MVILIVVCMCVTKMMLSRVQRHLVRLRERTNACVRKLGVVQQGDLQFGAGGHLQSIGCSGLLHANEFGDEPADLRAVKPGCGVAVGELQPVQAGLKAAQWATRTVK